MPEIRPRADVLAAGQRDAGSTRTSTRKTFALERVIKVVGQRTIAAWLALETRLLTGALKHAAAWPVGSAGPSVVGIR